MPWNCPVRSTSACSSKEAHTTAVDSRRRTQKESRHTTITAIYILITMTTTYDACMGSLAEQLPRPVAAAKQPEEQRSTVLQPPTSLFQARCHPLVHEVSGEVNDYFLEHWPFPDARSRKRFVGAGFSRATCLYFPLARDDRITYACRLLTLLFLIDGTYTDPPPIPSHPTLMLMSCETSLSTCHSKMERPTMRV